MNLKPLDDRIVVKPNEAEKTTASGLVIPDTAKEKPQEGTVVAVGPGRWSDDTGKHTPLDIKVGDVVLYSKYGGTEVTSLMQNVKQLKKLARSPDLMYFALSTNQLQQRSHTV